jgi:hypothetical protein
LETRAFTRWPTAKSSAVWSTEGRWDRVRIWETAEELLSDGGMTPEEIMEKLEERVGPQGRKLFEDFLRKVNKLQAQQYLGQALT